MMSWLMPYLSLTSLLAASVITHQQYHGAQKAAVPQLDRQPTSSKYPRSIADITGTSRNFTTYPAQLMPWPTIVVDFGI